MRPLLVAALLVAAGGPALAVCRVIVEEYRQEAAARARAASVARVQRGEIAAPASAVTSSVGSYGTAGGGVSSARVPSGTAPSFQPAGGLAPAFAPARGAGGFALPGGTAGGSLAVRPVPQVNSGGRFLPPRPATTYANGFIVDSTDNPTGQTTLATGDTITVTAGNTVVGNNHTGVFTQSGGTFNTSLGNSLILGSAPGSNGTFYLQGGNLKAGFTYVGFSGVGTFNQSGGTFDATSGGGTALSIGYDKGSNSAYNLSDGTLNTAETIISQGANTSSFNQTGGTHTTGALSMADFVSTSNATYNLDGGTLNTGLVRHGTNGATGTSTFNFNGGTLQASADSTTFFQGLTTAQVRNGGAFIDTNGHNVTVAQTLSHAGISEDNPIDGGLTKQGAGNLTLTANNTYTGTTLVQSGALFVNNVPAKAGDSGTGSGPVYVAPGTWLGGNGVIGGDVTVGAYPPTTDVAGRPRLAVGMGTLTPGPTGPNSTGILTINGSLTLTDSAVLEANLGGSAAGSGYDQVKIGGQLTIDGELTLTLLNSFHPTPGEKFYLLDGTGPTLVSGIFANAPAGSLITDSAGNLYLINYADHDPADTSNLLFNDVSLTVVPEPSTWALLGLSGAGLLGLTLRRRATGA